MPDNPELKKLEAQLNALIPYLNYAGRPSIPADRETHRQFHRATFHGHDLVIEWCEFFVSHVWLVVAGKPRPHNLLEIYHHYWRFEPGPHWPYLLTVFAPWLTSLAKAERLKDTLAADAARQKAEEDRRAALATWAGNRGALVAPEPVTIDDTWGDLKR